MTLGGTSVLAAGAGLLSARYQAGSLATTFREIQGLGLKNKIRVLHLSDFHASSCVPWELIRASIDKGLSHKPDLVFLTGDFITHTSFDVTGYADHLRALADHPHCFACLGNHDGSYKLRDETKGLSTAQKLEAEFGKANVKLLYNQSIDLRIKGSDIVVAGLADLWRKGMKPEDCLKKNPANKVPTLLLAHNPDTKDKVPDYHWDVMFSGHTHGGQVVVPIINWAPTLPVEDRSMVAGLYPWRGRHVHITRGVGNLHGIRFNCPPEVSVIDLI